MKKYNVYTDATVLRSGFSIAAVVINKDDGEIIENYKTYSSKSKPKESEFGHLVNLRETMAIHLALFRLFVLGLKEAEIIIYSDSQFAIENIKEYIDNGIAKNKELLHTLEAIDKLYAKFKNIQIEKIDRKNNFADKLCRRLLTERSISKAIKKMKIYHIEDDTYYVQSKSDKSLFYKVDLENESCECLQYFHNKDIVECTHVKAAKIFKIKGE